MTIKIKKHIKQGIPLAGMIIFLYSTVSYAGWQIDISRFRDDICRTQYVNGLCNGPSKVGNYATKQECENARYQYCGRKGEPYCMTRTYCTGYDSNTPSQMVTPQQKLTNEEKEIIRYLIKEGKLDEETVRISTIEDLKMIILIERKRVLSKIAAEEAAKRMTKNLESPKSAPQPQFQGLKLKLQDMIEKVKTIQEMCNIAGWSLIAAREASDVESARARAGWGFDEWVDSKGSFDIKSIIPEVPVPESQTSQFMAFTYIANWAGDMYTKILMLTEKQRENEKKSYELQKKSFELQVKRRNEFEPVPLSTRLTEEQKKKQEYLDNLEKQAQNLTKEAEGLLKEAQEMKARAHQYFHQVIEMQKEFYELVNDPSKSSSFLARRTK